MPITFFQGERKILQGWKPPVPSSRGPAYHISWFGRSWWSTK